MFERFTERARQVVVLAQEEARTLKHNYIGTEHVLLGLTRENEGVAARILLDLDAHSEKIRSELIRMLSGPEGQRAAQEARQTGNVGAAAHHPAPSESRIIVPPALAGVVGAALSQASSEGRVPDDGHLLLALSRPSDSVAASALERLGVTPEAIHGALEPGRRRLQELKEKIDEVRRAKEDAITAQEFEVAAGHRDRERRLILRMLDSRRWFEDEPEPGNAAG